MNTKKITFLAIGLILSIVIQAQDASNWRGPSADGKYAASNLMKAWPENGPEILWSYEDLGKGFSSPVIYNGKIYITGATEPTGYVYILDMDGKLLNKYPYGKEFFESYKGTRSTPTLAGDLLYMFSGYGVITCFKADTGEKVWSKDTFNDYDGENIRWGITETVVVDGDVVYVTPGGKKNFLLALNRHNGDLIWSSEGIGEKSAYCTPLVLELPSRKLVITHSESHILGIDAKDGKVLWSYDHPNTYSVHPNTPIYHDGGIFYFSGYGQGGGMLELTADGSSIKQKWFSDRLDSRMGGAVLHEGNIYLSGDKNKYWFCIDWNTGEEKYAVKDIAIGVNVFADGMLYCYGQKGELALVKATPEGFIKTGQTKVKLGSEQHWAHPVIHNGILYLHHGSALIAYKVK